MQNFSEVGWLLENDMLVVVLVVIFNSIKIEFEFEFHYTENTTHVLQWLQKTGRFGLHSLIEVLSQWTILLQLLVDIFSCFL